VPKFHFGTPEEYAETFRKSSDRYLREKKKTHDRVIFEPLPYQDADNFGKILGKTTLQVVLCLFRQTAETILKNRFTVKRLCKPFPVRFSRTV